jgi:twitching motility protein PilT
MVTLEQSLSALVQAGMVTYEDALMRSLYPRDIQRHARVPAGATA